MYLVRITLFSVNILIMSFLISIFKLNKSMAQGQESGLFIKKIKGLTNPYQFFKKAKQSDLEDGLSGKYNQARRSCSF